MTGQEKQELTATAVTRAELRAACVWAHETYHWHGVYGYDLEVSNYDDEESFVEKVDGGYWVEARVWVPEDAIQAQP